MSVISTMETAVTFIVTVVLIVMMMIIKTHIMMKLSVKVLPKVNYLMIGFNKFCAP